MMSFVSSRACVALAFVLCLAASPVAFAARSSGEPVVTLAPPAAGPEIARAQSYLSGLGTARARFLQTAPDGSEATGTFYLKRPGRLRFEYDPPAREFVVADGLLIYFYDGDLGEQSNAPIGQTLADFLLRDNLRLSGDVRVTEVKRAGGLLQIQMVQTSDPVAGSLTLGFTESPFALRKWRVVDSQGLITEVELFNLETGVALSPSLFIYRDPGADVRRLNP
ncbi:MAG TPA: outer membrane lipoprotein carrier protein LolA [Alphaproteobacteria bacterium]|nr:outer membrane lipoprotein carrier protein LolA [Alphaproteobacteria bacterium]